MNIIQKWFYGKFEYGFENFQYKKSEVVGDIYCGFFRGMATSGFCPINTSFGPGQRVTVDFYSFRSCEIEGLDRTRIKLWGDWYSLEDVCFKNDPTDKSKSIIERHEQAKKEVLENAKWCREKEIEIDAKYPRRGIF